MSTPGSVRSGEASAYTPPAKTAAGAPSSGQSPRKRTRLFRWKGIAPLALVIMLLVAGWSLFGERVIRGTIVEAGTKALGAQLDIAGLKIRALSGSAEFRGITLADPFDRTRNLVEIALVRVELEPKPLLERKLVVRRLDIADVRTGTRRRTPATVVTGPGFAPRAMAQVRGFARSCPAVSPRATPTSRASPASAATRIRPPASA